MKSQLHTYIAATILIMILSASGLLASDEQSGNGSLLSRCGVAIPLSELQERADIYLPALSLSYRIAPNADFSYLLVDFELSFFAYKAERTIAGEQARIFSETLIIHVMALVHLWRELYFSPIFGVGMIFNEVTESSSSGLYSHVGCAAGAELYYQLSSLISIHLRIRALFGLDRDRVFYHLIPDLGVAFRL